MLLVFSWQGRCSAGQFLGLHSRLLQVSLGTRSGGGEGVYSGELSFPLVSDYFIE
jgi:hypothetical protein